MDTTENTAGPSDGAPLVRKQTVRERLLAKQARMHADKPAAAEAARTSPRAGGPRLQRNKRQSTDPLWIDPRVIPPGYVYEWKRTSVYGQPDETNINNMKENHWAPVPSSRHPGILMQQQGLMLMERPEYLSEEAIDEGYQIAVARLDTAISQLSEVPAGHFGRGNSPGAKAATIVNNEYGIAIPE